MPDHGKFRILNGATWETDCTPTALIALGRTVIGIPYRRSASTGSACHCAGLHGSAILSGMGNTAHIGTGVVRDAKINALYAGRDLRGLLMAQGE
jgi:hypothetical protein